MEEIFGVPMTVIAMVSVAATLAVLAFVGLIAVRNPVMFKTGLRNIPRRPAQTTLIIIGLMLSTLIVTAAFGTGDTIASSVTAEVYNTLGEADEVIEWDASQRAAPLERQIIPLPIVAQWREQLEGDPDIEALVPFLSEVLPVLNEATRLNEPSARLVAFRAEDARALGGLRDLEGRAVELGRGDIAVNKKLAEQIEAQPGQRVAVLYKGQPIELVVKAIVPNEVLGGSFTTERRQGAAVDFDLLSELTGKGNSADAVFVSNRGGVKSGLVHSAEATRKLESLVGAPYKVTPFKADGIKMAKLVGSLFTTFFVVMGLFSIAAGILLIFLIFIMLAAERQPEMGMARAVGAKRRQIVESFLAEGLGYDLGSAVIGLFAGMGVTVAMVSIIRAVAGERLGLTLDITFTLRSLVVAFCIGLLATFLVITLASWRASRLNIVAAIRDLPETRPINPEDATLLGYLRAALNGIALMSLPIGLCVVFLGLPGLVLAVPFFVTGIVAPWFYLLRTTDYARPADHRVGEPAPHWPWVIGGILVLLGVGLLVLVGYATALLLIRLTRDRKPTALPIWLPVAGMVVPPLGFGLALLQDYRARISWSAGLGFAMAVGGVALMWTGLETRLAFLLMLGLSFCFFAAAATLRYFHVAERPSFTVTGMLLLLVWYVIPTGRLHWLVGRLHADVEMFFLSGFAMVTAGTFVVVYNADIILPLVAAVGSRFGRIVPALKTGIAYPLTARFRTGMTVAMIGLIMFALVMFSTMNVNFERLFLDKDALAGWDVQAVVNSNNRIDDFREKAGVVADASKITAVGEVRAAFPFEAEVENRDRKKDSDGEVPEYLRFTVLGADQAFLDASSFELKARAAGYRSDEDIWNALESNPRLAVLPALVTAGGGGFGPPQGEDLLRLNPIKDGFQPFELKLRDPGGQVTVVTVVGQMKDATTQFWPGIMVTRQTLLDAFPESQGQSFYIALQEGTDAERFAKDLESGLVQASVESLSSILDDQRAASSSFMLVFQGFVGLGLVVGLAALAVVAFRNVVERRQQIGMLRAIGYQRRMVALSFVFESGFVAMAGIGLGLTLGLSLAWILFTGGEFGEETRNTGFAVPWLQLAVICGLAFGSSIIMTILPARSASRVPVAEALRYE